MRLFLIGLFFVIASVATSFAKNNCAQDKAGHIVCAPQGGTIMTNKDGVVVCGPGQCVVNMAGVIVCSSQPGGTASINSAGVPVCAGVCFSASPKYCKGAR